MNNETKRDVFEEFADKWAGLDDERYEQYLKQYDAALPDDLPVIPKEVGEILRSAHGQTNLLDVLETAKNGYKVSDTLEWIIANQNTFALAWVLEAWKVDETGEIVKLDGKE